jgi:ferredoxin-NADP reductase
MRTPSPAQLTWTIRETREETPLVRSLVLYPKETVLLPGHEPLEGKSYSISSTPNGESLTLTIKRMGRFSNALCALEVGDTLTTSLPYGFFYPDEPISSTLVCIAGGIGIAPLVSIIESLLTQGHLGTIRLLYSNQTAQEVVFHTRLEYLQKTYPQFRVEYFITRAQQDTQGMHARRMTVPDIMAQCDTVSSADFFLCGSSSFTRDLWTTLRQNGVGTHQIYTEGFF